MAFVHSYVCPYGSRVVQLFGCNTLLEATFLLSKQPRVTYCKPSFIRERFYFLGNRDRDRLANKNPANMFVTCILHIKSGIILIGSLANIKRSESVLDVGIAKSKRSEQKTVNSIRSSYTLAIQASQLHVLDHKIYRTNTFTMMNVMNQITFKAKKSLIVYLVLWRNSSH